MQHQQLGLIHLLRGERYCMISAHSPRKWFHSTLWKVIERRIVYVRLYSAETLCHITTQIEHHPEYHIGPNMRRKLFVLWWRFSETLFLCEERKTEFLACNFRVCAVIPFGRCHKWGRAKENICARDGFTSKNKKDVIKVIYGELCIQSSVLIDNWPNRHVIHTSRYCRICTAVW